MRQDKTFVRILLIFSVANVAIAAPAAVRQRHLDVAKVASEKRAPGSGNGATGGDLPPESSPPMAPHDRPADMSRWAWLLWPDSPKSSSTAENHITTQASEAPGSGNGATSDLPPESPSRMPLHDTDDWAWFYRLWSQPELPESSSAPANHITTQASGADNGATGDLPPASSSRIPPHNGPANEWTSSSHGSPANKWAWLDDAASSESSSAAANRITTQAPGAMTPSSPAHLGDQPPHQGSPESLAESVPDWLHRTAGGRKILAVTGFLGLFGGAAALGYEYAQ